MYFVLCVEKSEKDGNFLLKKLYYLQLCDDQVIKLRVDGCLLFKVLP